MPRSAAEPERSEVRAGDEGPWALLRHLERLGLGHREPLPAQEAARDVWSGVGFRIGGQHYVAALGDVAEIMTWPAVSRVPHTRSWVRGLANVRGNLLPILDLSAFLGRGEVAPSRLVRVLVIEQQGVNAGLLVDEVLGMRQFDQADWQESVSAEAGITPFLDGRFSTAEGEWPVFSMAALARHPRFLSVAD
ncbi:chemotaxis protein CheW [Spiribacter halobius]|uniref:Chemotaxis protein CheW n=1 Tax=Sediminicurvatus halobius TaxID=2182432 RepID=A0A2U2MYN0_9GAMM|nr:chemotaxis protein CheW [Spiribacter halobius]PWG61990.1 chemotaxis protein CheW [Spiribacter halobius]UEX78396.1 chemotaxis protein CheW [Spiribacter halobius]